MPESDGPVARTSHEPCQAIFLLQALALCCLGEADAAALMEPLNIMNWSIVRQERANDLDLLSVLDVPQKDHLVAVDCNDSMPLLVSNDCQDI
jgi:hypothetical protein